MTQIETTILKGLIYNEDYTRKVLPYIQDVYFETPESNTLFNLISKYFTKYDSCPTEESIAIDVENLTGLSSVVHQSLCDLCTRCFEGNSKSSGSDAEDGETSTTPKLEWLIDATESWCKERAVHLALLESIQIHDGQNPKKGRDSIPELLSNALSVSFDDHIGHNYLSDYDDRYNFYHRKENKISFGIEILDKITKGGMPNKTLNIALAGCVHPETKVRIRFRKIS